MYVCMYSLFVCLFLFIYVHVYTFSDVGRTMSFIRWFRASSLPVASCMFPMSPDSSVMYVPNGEKVAESSPSSASNYMADSDAARSVIMLLSTESLRFRKRIFSLTTFRSLLKKDWSWRIALVAFS